MTYKIIADKINIRSSIQNNKPRVVIRATAAIANKKHIAEYSKRKDGSIKTLKSMFTTHCIQSIKEQSKNKGIFVDIQHELAREASMKTLVKNKLTAEEQKQFENMMKRKRLPLMKMNDIDILDDKLDLEAEMNASFPEVDEDHKRLYDAVVYSLQNKFLNGISINFGDFTYAKDDKGDVVIDDAEVLGFSCLDTPAEHMNHIYDVAIRAIEDKTGETKMDEEEKKKFEAEKAQFEADKKKFEDTKAEEQKQKDAATEEAKKAEDIKKQEADQKKIEDDLAAKTEELKKAQEEAVKSKAELDSVKGLAAKNTPNNIGDSRHNDVAPEKLYPEKLKEITAGHDKTMETIKAGKVPLIDKRMDGIAELINLQAQANNPAADLSKENQEYIKENKLLEKGNADIITPRTEKT